MPTTDSPRISFARMLVPVWLVTAAWDAVCASGLNVFAYHGTAAKVWQGVASTVLGPSALDGGTTSVVEGLVLHTLVALTWSATFLAAARALPALRRAIQAPSGAFAVAVVYGPIIWLAMSLIVMPLATHRPPRFGPRWWVQFGAHVPFVTLPLVFTARRMLQPSRTVSGIMPAAGDAA